MRLTTGKPTKEMGLYELAHNSCYVDKDGNTRYRDFDIDVEVSGGGSPSDSILIVTITTVNYGILIGTLLLENQNSVHINIECSEKFPKEELLKRMSEDEKIIQCSL